MRIGTDDLASGVWFWSRFSKEKGNDSKERGSEFLRFFEDTVTMDIKKMARRVFYWYFELSLMFLTITRSWIHSVSLLFWT